MQSNAWDKLPSETDRQYKVFTSYLRLGKDRSLAKVGEEWGKSGVPSNWEKWRSMHNWVERATAYDAHLVKEALAAQSQTNITAEISAFRKRSKDSAIAQQAAGYKLLLKITPAIDSIDVKKLKPSEIAALTRAAVMAIEGGLNGEAISTGCDRLQESINNAQKADNAV